MRTRRRILPRRLLPPQFAHAARVAGAATLIIAIVYTGCVTALNLVVAHRLTGQTDARLSDRLTEASRSRITVLPAKDGDDDGDVDDAPLFLWLVSPGGHVSPLSSDAPALPGGLRPGAGWPVTTVIGGSPFRLAARRTGSQWIVAGQSLAQNRHTESVLLGSELAAAPLLLIAMFLGSLTVGLKALGPVEQSRRRQLEFTADASHELRTPLSVISAEADIALASPRSAAEYQGALTRIQGEGKRLRLIVEDLLWLARFDSQPPPPGESRSTWPRSPARARAGSARSPGRARSPVADTDTQAPALISAPPEWIDRLAGVLMDNACRYAGRAARSGSAWTRWPAGSAWPSRTAARAFRRRNAGGCSTVSTARPATARAQDWGWPSRTRSPGQPAAAGASAARHRSAEPGWPYRGAGTSPGISPWATRRPRLPGIRGPAGPARRGRWRRNHRRPRTEASGQSTSADAGKLPDGQPAPDLLSWLAIAWSRARIVVSASRPVIADPGSSCRSTNGKR